MFKRACLFIAFTALASPTLASAQTFGRFVPEAVTATWLPDGRLMKLTEDFAYIDLSGKEWSAPKGSEVDGASIPRAFWTIVGGPFEGQYRNASVVHDVACKQMKEKWQDVHRMFYSAMRAGGVGERQALVMYAAVYQFGPRWSEPRGFFGRIVDAIGGIFTQSGPPPPPPPPPPEPTEKDFQDLERMIEQNKLTRPEDVERLLSGHK